MKINGKILFKNIWYNAAGFLLLIVQGLVVILLGIFRVWRYFLNSVQQLRYPPQQGGMYGNMAKRLKNKSNTPKDV